jgi:uncharacterized Ntn-hydrolase superfamily protein
VTYSIVARDATSGELGVAIASRSFNLSWLCSWAAAGTGAVATQASTNPAFGPGALELLRAGSNAADVVAVLVGGDPIAHERQLAVVDAQGRAAAHTGTACTAHAAHVVGDGFSVQGNLLASPDVVPSMAEAFRSSGDRDGDSNGALARRLLVSMEAGQAAGGDARGQQSAVLLVVSGDAAAPPWARLVDFQVADSAAPLAELRRLLDVQDRLQRSGRGIHAVFDGRLDEALELLEPMVDDVPEIAFNRVLAFFAAGRLDDARREAARLYELAPRWRGLALYAARVPGAAAFLDEIG